LARFLGGCGAFFAPPPPPPPHEFVSPIFSFLQKKLSPSQRRCFNRKGAAAIIADSLSFPFPAGDSILDKETGMENRNEQFISDMSGRNNAKFFRTKDEAAKWTAA
jgi:hypothetical protein